MSIIFKKSGILTTLQDSGRFYFRRFGINPNGVMDFQAMNLINTLLGNDKNETVLEIHFPAPIIEFKKNAIISIGGADFGATLNNRAIENWQSFFVEKNSVLEFQRRNAGNRAYLAVKDGFAFEKRLGSGCLNLVAEFGGFYGRKFQKGDELCFNKQVAANEIIRFKKISRNIVPKYQKNLASIRIIKGSGFELLTALSDFDFLSNTYNIGLLSDRMGFRLEGQPLYLIDDFELISSAVCFGTIQLLPNGQLIILMADHQTTGGYPRIAHIITADLPILAQLGSNDKVKFELIDQTEAENLLLHFAKDLNMLKIGCEYGNY